MDEEGNSSKVNEKSLPISESDYKVGFFFVAFGFSWIKVVLFTYSMLCMPHFFECCRPWERSVQVQM